MTTLTASQLLGAYADRDSAPRRLLDAWGDLARRLAPAGRRRRPAGPVGDLSDHILRDIGMTHADVEALDRAR